MTDIKMGLDYSYLLYFPKNRLWEVLDGVASLVDLQSPGTRILFEDGEKLLALNSWGGGKQAYHHTDPCFNFSISLRFPLDNCIQDYLQEINQAQGLPGVTALKSGSPVGIGMIHLWAYQDLSAFSETFNEPDLASLIFEANGTRMSLLFDESNQIRETFLHLLADHGGIGGLIDYESDAMLFHWRGKALNLSVGSVYTSPTEIDAILTGGSGKEII